MENKLIRESLENLPSTIAKKETELYQLILETTGLEAVNKNIELQSKFNVRNIKGGDGKKLYTNETDRSKAVTEELEMHSGYMATAQEIDENKKRTKELEIALGLVKRTFRAAESLTRLGE